MIKDVQIYNPQSIVYQPAGQFEETRYEKNHNIIFNNSLL